MPLLLLSPPLQLRCTPLLPVEAFCNTAPWKSKRSVPCIPQSILRCILFLPTGSQTDYLYASTLGSSPSIIWRRQNLSSVFRLPQLEWRVWILSLITLPGMDRTWYSPITKRCPLWTFFENLIACHHIEINDQKSHSWNTILGNVWTNIHLSFQSEKLCQLSSEIYCRLQKTSTQMTSENYYLK